MSAEFLGKKYKMVSSDKFEDIMKALGIGVVTRKMAGSIYPTVELLEDNGVYNLKTTSTFKSTDVKFKLGEEFDEKTADGRTVKSIITLDGNKMTHIQKGDKETVIEREFTPNEMTAIMKVDDIVCTRVYKAQA